MHTKKIVILSVLITNITLLNGAAAPYNQRDFRPKPARDFSRQNAQDLQAKLPVPLYVSVEALEMVEDFFNENPAMRERVYKEVHNAYDKAGKKMRQVQVDKYNIRADIKLANQLLQRYQELKKAKRMSQKKGILDSIDTQLKQSSGHLLSDNGPLTFLREGQQLKMYLDEPKVFNGFCQINVNEIQRSRNLLKDDLVRFAPEVRMHATSKQRKIKREKFASLPNSSKF